MIHLSLVRTDIDEALLARMIDALSPAEQTRAARFRQLADRRRHVVARTVLKGLLAERLACEPADLRLVTGVHGKPALAADTLSTDTALPHFNLSHSGDLALIAIAPVAVGVDIECDPPDEAPSLAQAWFTLAEQARLARGEDDFLSLWTAREAVLKAAGTGFFADRQAFSLPSNVAASARAPRFDAVHALRANSGFDGYLVARLDLAGVCAGAIPATLVAPYRAAISVQGPALPLMLACEDPARFVCSATLAAVAPASVDAACLLP